MGDADRAATRVAVGSAVRPQLVQLLGREVDPGLLLELPDGAGSEVLVHLEVAAGQGPLPLEQRVPTSYDEQVEPLVDRGQRDDVDGDVDPGVVGYRPVDLPLPALPVGLRSLNFCSLPVAVRASSSRNSTDDGALNRATLDLQ